MTFPCIKCKIHKYTITQVPEKKTLSYVLDAHCQRENRTKVSWNFYYKISVRLNSMKTESLEINWSCSSIISDCRLLSVTTYSSLFWAWASSPSRKIMQCTSSWNLHHLHVEVVRYPSQVANVISWIRTGSMSWLEKFSALYQVDGENENLVPCQNLAHAITATEAKRNQPLILGEPENKQMVQDRTCSFSSPSIFR